MSNMFSSDTIVVASTLFDGKSVSRGNHALGGSDEAKGGIGVLVGEGRILSVGPEEQLRAESPDAVVHRYRNATLTPGLIDSHVHLTLPGDGTQYERAAAQSPETRFRTAFINMRTHLEGGVTLVRDLASHRDFLNWAPEDELVLPRLLRYGPPLTAPDGHMHPFGGGVASAEDAQRMVEKNLADGANGVKVVGSGGGTVGTNPHEASLELEVIEAAVSSAHKAGKIVTTHALAHESISRAIAAGTDGIEHLGFLLPEGGSEFNYELAQLAISRGVTFGSTLGVNNRYTGRAAAGELDPFELFEQAERTDAFVRNAARMRELGARVVAASDAGWKYTAFGDFANELRLLTLANYTPVDALRMATGEPAEYLRIADKVGYVRQGLRADLAVFDGDATLDISAVKRARAVYRDGVRVYARLVD